MRARQTTCNKVTVTQRGLKNANDNARFRLAIINGVLRFHNHTNNGFERLQG
jgi:hypothetical protein